MVFFLGSCFFLSGFVGFVVLVVVGYVECLIRSEKVFKKMMLVFGRERGD